MGNLKVLYIKQVLKAISLGKRTSEKEFILIKYYKCKREDILV
jgi:hypothetical protein